MNDSDEGFADGIFWIDAYDLFALLAGDLVLAEVIERLAKDFISALVVAINLRGTDGMLRRLLVIFALKLDGAEDKV